MRTHLANLIADRRFEQIITALVIVNAATLGLESSRSIMEQYGRLLTTIDHTLLSIFIVEIAARLYVKRLAFFRDPWSVFDFLVVGIAIIPASESLSVLRTLRVLRVLRLITLLPSLRRVVGGLIAAMPGMGSIMLLLGLIFYVFAVMGTKMFSGTAPEQFGSLGATAFTLFQVMTFDDWSNGIVKPLIEPHPYAIVFFIVFILLSAFMMLNLFIGVVVSALDDERPAKEDKLLHSPADSARLAAEISAMREEVAALRRELSQRPRESQEAVG